MFRLITFALVLLSTPALAQWGGTSILVLNPQIAPPAGSPGLPTVDDNYQTLSRAGVCAERGHEVPCTNHYAITRASVKYCQNISLIWRPIGSGMPAICNTGWLIEEARINTALWSRDMTQSGTWIAVGTGVALNATGIDGTANSATTLTATGTASSCVASCTILQTLVIGSTAETYSVWLKRVTGSGTVNITINNLTGVTACTVTSTTEFTRCTVTATLANPVIGIQMVTLNDVIIADFNQLEAGAFPTSPVLTTTVSATRAADNVTLVGLAATALTGADTLPGSAFVQTNSIEQTSFTSSPIVSALSGAVNLAAAGPLFIGVRATTIGRSQLSGATQQIAATAGAGDITLGKLAAGWDSGSRSLVFNNGTIATNANAFGTVSTPRFGSMDGATATTFLDAYYPRLTLWNIRLPDATLKGMTQ